ncbi:MAG: Nramp family divalent metal transporter [Thermoanaerobaculales bacterium]|jgi:Mn2+/Fe2+ NRAMP family transporter|nr:Nramp family divalent metal transporter [Thermoanaerobaculales bacterium]
MRRLLDLLFWSVIAAAFIGPGTVTTAARAGSDHGLALAWALLFSTAACLVLQEASGRVTVVTGLELGEAVRRRFPRAVGWLPPVLAGGVILGCAAYQAGNLLGAVAGLRLAVDGSAVWLTLICGAASAALLATGSTRLIAQVLGAVVALMGIVFLVTAVRVAPDLGALLEGLLVPRAPRGSAVLVLGLVGTTVVPYNLFLGSALARGHILGEMRWGLAVAVGGGGLISLGVLVVGTVLGGGLEFDRLAAVLSERLGPAAGWSLAFGLFGAGFTSAITAPLAAAITARTLLGGEGGPDWSERGWRYRSVWAGVLLTGVLVAVTGVRPIPAIILAQAFNGLVLPLTAVFLWIVINDREQLGAKVNGRLLNLVTGAVVAVCLVLGVRGLLAAVRSVTTLLG